MLDGVLYNELWSGPVARGNKRPHNEVIPPCSQERELKKDNTLNIDGIFTGFS
jgi:hypothetical protein